METVSIEIDRGQLIDVITRLDDDFKLKIFNELKKSLFKNRFNSLLNSLKSDDLSLEEITKEVESVRTERYENGKQEY